MGNRIQFGEIYDGEKPDEAAQWRKKWLSGVKLGKSYDVKAHYNAVKWLLNRARRFFDYHLGEFAAQPFCTELVLEVLQRHGGRPILPFTIDRLEDITLGLGAGFSLQGEVCGAVTGHIIAIGIDVAYRTRETALIRKDVSEATRRFCNLFKEKFGAIRFKDFAAICFLKDDDSVNPDSLKEFITGDPPRCLRCDDFLQFCVYAPLPSEGG